jgi:putative membrane protein
MPKSEDSNYLYPSRDINGRHKAQTEVFIINKYLMEIVDLKYVVASIVYAFIGIVILVISFIIVEKLSPQNLWKEISQNKNTALAMMASAYILAVAIIIASAIH